MEELKQTFKKTKKQCVFSLNLQTNKVFTSLRLAYSMFHWNSNKN